MPSCRPPAVKEDDDYEPPGQPEVLADIDFAEVCASGPSDEVARPSWYRHEHGAELMHSQVCSSSQGCHSACWGIKRLTRGLAHADAGPRVAWAHYWCLGICFIRSSGSVNSAQHGRSFSELCVQEVSKCPKQRKHASRGLTLMCRHMHSCVPDLVSALTGSCSGGLEGGLLHAQVWQGAVAC